jgi:ABC-type dipeptide/oligopeptide/nickel transport system permease subunit
MWNSMYFQDVLVALLVGVMVWIGVTMSRREYWRLAFRQVFIRRGVRISFFILCLYTMVALLDSVGYHPTLKDQDGNPRRDPKTEKVLIDKDGLTLLDLACTKLRNANEKTYSAPLATKQFTKETVYNEETEVNERVYPDLKYPRIHLLGTDQVGGDVLYQALKGIRTGMILGLMTTLIVIPFAIFFGVLAGYTGGLIDDVVQFVYTVLSSIPSVLLIVAFMSLFEKPGLVPLCVILGITSWTGLCRVLRGEAMKLREMEYIQAAEANGIPRWKIMFKHVAPNVMHLVLITAVLGFSGRVMSEAFLTYIGIGVGMDTMSWGVMINDALGEFARDPVVWWKLTAAFIFMFGLVLPANLFGDALRDALDPRLRTE